MDEKPEIPKKPKKQPAEASIAAPSSNGKHEPDESSRKNKREYEGDVEELGPKKVRKTGDSSAKGEDAVVVDDDGGSGAILIDDD